jgi:hypothetical protein
MSSLALVDAHASQQLGREVEPEIVIPRPPLKLYPGPAVAWPAAILFGALFSFGYFTFRYTLSPGFYQFIGACALGMLLLAVFTTINRARMHLKVSLRELGVVLNGRAVRFAELDALTVADSRRYDNERNVIAMNRTITLETQSGRVRVSYLAVPNDPVDPVLDVITATMTARQHRGYRGRGWSIDGNTLVAGATRIPLATISAAGVYDDEVRIWLHGESHRALAVPVSSRNARVLLAIAAKTRTAAPPAMHAASQQPTAGIGRLLFTRRTSLFSTMFSTAIYLPLTKVLHLVMQREGLPFADETAMAVAALVVLLAIRRVTRVYRFHERGVIVGGRTLLFDDVATMRWVETSTLINHAIYVGTSMKVKLTPREGRPLVIRLYRWRANDDDLLPMRYAISTRIAETLRVQLQREGRAPWVRGAAFTTGGIEVKKQLLAFDRPLHGFMRNGYFILFRERWQKPSAVLPASEDNFYPGLALFETLTSQRP